jgi:hypothetical protein
MKTKIKTLAQFIAQFADKAYECQLDYDQAFDNLIYARAGMKTYPDKTNFDWPAYLDNAQKQYNYASSQLELAKYQARRAEKSYPRYVELETKLNSLKK